MFSDINISQGSVATPLRCGGICNDPFLANFLLSVIVKEFKKMIILCWNIHQSIQLTFLSHPVESLGYIFVTDSIVYLHSNFRVGLRKTHVFWDTVRNGPSRSSKVVDFGTNRKRVCDFLLVINSNLGPCSEISCNVKWNVSLAMEIPDCVSFISG